MYGRFDFYHDVLEKVNQIKHECPDVELSIQFEGPEFFEDFDSDDLEGMVPTDGEAGDPLY